MDEQPIPPSESIGQNPQSPKRIPPASLTERKKNVRTSGVEIEARMLSRINHGGHECAPENVIPGKQV